MKANIKKNISNMWIAKDKSGTVLISENKPERRTSNWVSPDNRYMVVNAKYGETLFSVKWEDEPLEIRVNFEI